MSDFIDVNIYSVKPENNLGVCRFRCIPSAGDMVRLGSASGGLDFYRVLYIEHGPVKLPPSPAANPNPRICIYVEYSHDAD